VFYFAGSHQASFAVLQTWKDGVVKSCHSLKSAVEVEKSVLQLHSHLATLAVLSKNRFKREEAGRGCHPTIGLNSLSLNLKNNLLTYSDSSCKTAI
jgi:hypothetical protein